MTETPAGNHDPATLTEAELDQVVGGLERPWLLPEDVLADATLSIPRQTEIAPVIGRATAVTP